MATQDQTSTREFNSFEKLLNLATSESQVFAYRMIKDSVVRDQYIKKIREMAQMIRDQVRSGNLSAQQGAVKAVEIRNIILEAERLRLSDLGGAFSRAVKPTPLSFRQLLSERTEKLWGRGSRFDQLVPSQRQRVFEEIIESAGRAKALVNKVTWA